MSKIRVVNIDEVNTPDLFIAKSVLLGQDRGRWFVVDENGTPFGRYINKEDADSHAEALNDDSPSPYDGFSVDELVEEGKRLIRKFNEET